MKVIALQPIHNHFADQLLDVGDDVTDFFNQLSESAKSDHINNGRVEIVEKDSKDSKAKKSASGTKLDAEKINPAE